MVKSWLKYLKEDFIELIEHLCHVYRHKYAFIVFWICYVLHIIIILVWNTIKSYGFSPSDIIHNTFFIVCLAIVWTFIYSIQFLALSKANPKYFKGFSVWILFLQVLFACHLIFYDFHLSVIRSVIY